LSSKKYAVDPNLWISVLMRGKVIKLDVLIGRENIRLVFSPELLQEFYDSANRVKFRRWFTEEAIDELIELINSEGEEVLVTSEVDACRDPKDNYLLALVKDANADYLITGDKDLLVLGSFANARIINYRTFMEELDKL
jgi:putative PIN family toxin of toxin-antitoxin system